MARLIAREDDLQTRRSHLAEFNEEQLEERFWQLCRKITAPLIELAASHTSPSIERSVLMRMGLDSLVTTQVVKKVQQAGLLGKGAGHLVLAVMARDGLELEAAARSIAAGRDLSLLLPSRPVPDSESRKAITRAPKDPTQAKPAAGERPARLSPLCPEIKLDVPSLLEGLEQYRARRRGWVWRNPGTQSYGKFVYRDMSTPLTRSIGLPASRSFGDIDPQPKQVITTEIASGRFEDDLRRMRMAAWHGADHIMVIRTAGQSHFDGIIEGTPEGIGGVPITRKQLRATRRALDLIEDEVGRPINLHSYVSGLAGPEMAVLFVEEGVNGAHQDPQYNVLYRNINMVRSFVDAAVAKHLMAHGEIFQIDGAHNANATAREAWCVLPELLVQHGINCAFSVAAGMKKELIGLSTVPPNSPPAPKLWTDLPYAVALRDFFREYKFRAQQNTRYIESDLEEASRTHVIDTLISALTQADIQSTITPDEGRNVPWHFNSVRGVQSAKQTFCALDGIKELVTINREGPLGAMVREIKERAVLFLEEIAAGGGYFQAVAQGHFVDSANYPARNADGIARDPEGGVAAGSVVPRDTDYLAPVSAHFGYNSENPLAELIEGDTLGNPALIPWIDELDEQDNANTRLKKLVDDRSRARIEPEVEWHGDGIVQLSVFFPCDQDTAEAAAIQLAHQMGISDPQVIHRAPMHPSEGTYLELKGRVSVEIDLNHLLIPEKPSYLELEAIESFVKTRRIKVVGATIGQDEHSVGMREILDIKHQGLEKYGFECTYLGTSVPPEKLVDAAIEVGAHAILASTIISHGDIHRTNMRRLHQICQERGVREKLLIIVGGTQVGTEMAEETGVDATFGRGTKGLHVADRIVRLLTARESTR